MQKFILLIAVVALLSCGQDNTKQKELEPKEKELALKENKLRTKEVAMAPSSKNLDTISKVSNLTKRIPLNTVEKSETIKCDSKYQLEGRLIGIYNFGLPCAYPYLKIITGEKKELKLFLDGNLDNFKVDRQNFFKWSTKKINNFIDNDRSISGQFPPNSYDINCLNKIYLYCCYKKQLGCGDDLNAPKDFFCKKILLQ